MTFYSDRLALVVGGSEGIGRAIAGELTARGCRVVLGARRLDALETARSEVSAAGVAVMDVSDWPSTRAAIDETVRRHGAPDFVVNCAGLAHPGWLTESTVEQIDEMMRTNFMGTAHVSKAVLPHLIERRAGIIVNTSSLGGLFGLYGYSGYCGSKFAVVGFSEALRREVAPYGIGVTILCPPNTRTPGLERENRQKPAEVRAQEEKVAVLDPASVARYLLDVLPRRPNVVIPSWDGRLAWRLSRWAPWLLDRLLRRVEGSH